MLTGGVVEVRYFLLSWSCNYIRYEGVVGDSDVALFVGRVACASGAMAAGDALCAATRRRACMLDAERALYLAFSLYPLSWPAGSHCMWARCR